VTSVNFVDMPRCSEWLIVAADSIGRCNTLSEQHCSAKMYLNQKNSQRFKGTPEPIAVSIGSLIPVTAPIAC
jgi:hypothetical protein